MTKEELEKRAFAEADKVVIGKGMDKRAVVYLRHLLKSMYVDGAISETELLSQHIVELQKDKGELIDKVKELEAQIEKMKCCGNCETVRDAEGNCYLLKDGKCKNKDKWEMKENAR